MRFLPAILYLVLARAVLADTAAPTVPDDSREAAQRAKESFEQGRYSDAEKLYEQIVASHPDNLYALSNLGVVYFRAQKWKLAEESLKKAVAVAPNDAFSHCTLGIIYYQEHLYDQAKVELNKALAIDPKNSNAREILTIIKSGAGPGAPPLSVGDFDTEHERQIRQSLGKIGLSPSISQ